MTDKMVDVGGRRRPATPTSAADIVGHQADVGRRHFFFQFADTHTNVVRRRRPECRRVSASVVRRRRPECRKTGPTMSAADTRRHSGRHSVCYPSVYCQFRCPTFEEHPCYCTAGSVGVAFLV